MLRQDVHSELKRQTGLKHISSEYGMTELLSQAYSHEDGLFTCPPWMRVEIRDLNDIHLSVPLGKTGRICIVDLANKWSCAFLATGDVGRLHSTGYFEVIGRADTSGSRGCSLMYSFS
jgi:acyl-coenzyme A synthetase/AMP-(fatty) acid ligase